MIIKQTRILSANSETATNYAVTQNSNEHVELLDGGAENLAFYAEHAAAGAGTKYGLRHFIISPGQALLPGQLERVIEALRDEWHIGSRPTLLTRHSKPGSTGRDDHYHFMVAENDFSGKVLDNTFFKIRNEKICRILEAEFGHEIIKGRHNKAVLNNILQKIDSEYDPQKKAELKELGHTLYKSGISQGQLPDPRANTGSKKKADRLNIDLDAFADHFKSIPKNGIKEFQNLLEEYGLEVRPGRKSGYLMLHQGDEVIGSLSRAVGIRVNEMKELCDNIYGAQNNEKANTRRKTTSQESSVDNFQQNGPGAQKYRENNRADNSGGERRARANSDRDVNRRNHNIGHNSKSFKQSSLNTDRDKQHDETRTEPTSRSLSKAALLKLQNVALTNVMNRNIDPLTKPILSGIRQEMHNVTAVNSSPSNGSIDLVKLNKQMNSDNIGTLKSKLSTKLSKRQRSAAQFDAGHSYNPAQSGGNYALNLDDPELMKKISEQNQYLGLR